MKRVHFSFAHRLECGINKENTIEKVRAFVCVCVCVRERERESEREREREIERERERESERV